MIAYLKQLGTLIQPICDYWHLSFIDRIHLTASDEQEH